MEDPLLSNTGPIILGKPGAAACGRGVRQVLDVIQELEKVGIHCCVSGAKALVYYGAHRVPQDWEICVPTDSFEKATALFTSAPLNARYEPWINVMPQPRSLIHTYPHFTLKDVNFFFFIMPAFEYRIDCDPEKCERSHMGVPYPKLEHFAQSLLDTQQYADLDDLVDGMNLTEEWGEKYLDLDKQGEAEYIKEKNRKILASVDLEANPAAIMMTLVQRPVDKRAKWVRSVRNKARRINDELPKDKYETRFRIKGRGDPRLNKNRQV